MGEGLPTRQAAPKVPAHDSSPASGEPPGNRGGSRRHPVLQAPVRGAVIWPLRNRRGAWSSGWHDERTLRAVWARNRHIGRAAVHAVAGRGGGRRLSTAGGGQQAVPLVV